MTIAPEQAANPETAADPRITARRARLAILARAARAELQSLMADQGGPPPHETLKAPVTGTVMVEGRAGGSGRRFNLGEATLTRCVIRLESGKMGFAYALGRDKAKARLAALIDARAEEEIDMGAEGVPQAGPFTAAIERLGLAQQAARALASRKAAATKVEFFTMVRGEG